jgi:hypothetical protein
MRITGVSGHIAVADAIYLSDDASGQYLSPFPIVPVRKPAQYRETTQRIVKV